MIDKVALPACCSGMRERIIASDGIEAADEALPVLGNRSSSSSVAAELGDNAGSAQPVTNRTVTQNSNPENREEPMSGNRQQWKEQAARRGCPGRTFGGARRPRAADRDERAGQREGRTARCRRTGARVARYRRAYPAGRESAARRTPGFAARGRRRHDHVRLVRRRGQRETARGSREVLRRPAGAGELPRAFRRPDAGSRPETPSVDNEAIAAEARTLMSEAADRGETLTAVEAVDRVRAKRGLTRI